MSCPALPCPAFGSPWRSCSDQQSARPGEGYTMDAMLVGFLQITQLMLTLF